jgi:hypothetical protein
VAEQNDHAAAMYEALGETDRADSERESGVHDREPAARDCEAGNGGP